MLGGRSALNVAGAFGAAKLIPVGGLDRKGGNKQGEANAHAAVSAGDKAVQSLNLDPSTGEAET